MSSRITDMSNSQQLKPMAHIFKRIEPVKPWGENRVRLMEAWNGNHFVAVYNVKSLLDWQCRIAGENSGN